MVGWIRDFSDNGQRESVKISLCMRGEGRESSALVSTVGVLDALILSNNRKTIGGKNMSLGQSSLN